MSISDFILRIADYCKRHGLAATMRRAGLAAQRMLFPGRMVVFSCDLEDRRLPRANIPETLKVERIRTLAELGADDFQEMISFWNAKLASRNICQRFEKGASLWLVKLGDRLAGYGWTLHGCTMEPYYFPLTKDDVHLFDFHVFPLYRGRGLNPYLIEHILDSLVTGRGGRAFIEAAEWNEAQLSSLRKTPFRRLGSVRSFTILGHTFVEWMEKQHRCEDAKDANPAKQILGTARSNEQ